MQKLKTVPISYYVLISMIVGTSMGVLYRFFPSQMSYVWIDPIKFKMLGTLFVRLVKMIVSPLVATSIIASILSIGSAEETGKLALNCLATFLIMTVVSVTIGISLVHYAKPGKNVSFDKATIIENSDKKIFLHQPKINTVGDFVISFIPRNIFESLLKDNLLQIIFFSVIFSIAALRLPKSVSYAAVNGIKSLSVIVSDMSIRITLFAPIGILGMSFWLVGTQNLDLLRSLGKLIIVVYVACVLVVYGAYSLFSIFVLRLNPWTFHKKIFPAQALGFLLASSSAVLPISLATAEKKLGVPKSKVDFIIPLGATLNMNGGAIYLGALSAFIAQLWGIDLTFGQYALMICLSTFGAIGTAPIPGSAIFLLVGILSALKLPVEAVAIALAIDRLLDMARTFTNISGDIFSAVIISRLNKDLNESIYKS